MSNFQEFTISNTTTSGNGTGLILDLKVSWQIPLYNWNASWDIINNGQGYKVGDTVTIPKPSGIEPLINFPASGITITVTKITSVVNIAENSLNPFDAIADYVQFPGMETKSHMDGPEHEVVYINELTNEFGKASYMDLALGGIRINSAKEWTNFTQLSAYFKKGIKVADLVNSPAGPPKSSNNFVEIAHALLTDSHLGAGELVGANAIGDMTIGAKFCEQNNFTWDGIISNKVNLREFLYEHATYNLLDFTVIGGKFNLIPAVPIDNTFKIAPNVKVDIKALFTDGNINDLKVSFLSPEERQLFTANVLYRKERPNGFPETKSVMLRLKGKSDAPAGATQRIIDTYNYGGSRLDPVETYDMSGFCTTDAHARKYAKYILKLRKEVDHGLSFKTAPQYCFNLAPGDYFRLVSEATHTSRYENGVITEDGEVISNNLITDTNASIYYWKAGTAVEKVQEASGVNFVTGAGLPRGVLFTLKNSVTSNRVYKLETISYVEDGLVEISGSHAPITDDGTLAILQGWENGTDSHFIDLIS